MKNKITISLLILVVILAGTFLVWQYENKSVPTPAVTPFVPTVAVKENLVATSSESSDQVPSYAYLFQEDREPMTSNIVGYFGQSAFAWYVPDWLAENWTGPGSSARATDENMIFVPKTKQPNDLAVSPIVFSVKLSTETFNAATLYDTEMGSIDPANIISNEVLLNQHAEGGITLIIETDTRIYHIQESDSGRIKDLYYIDGNGKTLTVTFDANANIFPQFSAKIRSMVEGIGELKAPQG